MRAAQNLATRVLDPYTFDYADGLREMAEANTWMSMSTTREETPKMSTTTETAIEKILLEDLPGVLETVVDPETNAADDAFDEYVALATKLGISSMPIATARLTRFLSKHEIPVYDMQKVCAFLTKLQKAENEKNGYTGRDQFPMRFPVWQWAPVKADTPMSDLITGTGNGTFSHPSMVYAEKIPFFALKRMDTILSEFPGARFFCSMLNMPNPDPFLVVKVGSSALAVIAHWDEPDFQLVEKKKD